jgi:hypothetical protein
MINAQTCQHFSFLKHLCMFDIVEKSHVASPQGFVLEEYILKMHLLSLKFT